MTGVPQLVQEFKWSHGCFAVKLLYLNQVYSLSHTYSKQ